MRAGRVCYTHPVRAVRPSERGHTPTLPRRIGGTHAYPETPMPAHDTPTVDEIDEALTWAALTPTRGDAWREWVDARLDDRLEVTASTTPTPPR